MAHTEANMLLDEILHASRLLIELDEEADDGPPSRLAEEVRLRRRALLDRLRKAR